MIKPTGISVQIKAPRINTNIQQPIQKSLYQSAFLVRRDASRNAPYKSGTLRRSIVEKVYTNKAEIWTNVAYANIQEYGGVVNAKSKRGLRFKVNGRWVIAKKVVIPARPYLVPALENNMQKIIDIFSSNIQKYLAQ